MNTTITKTWTISISESEVFSRCVNESLYRANNVSAENTNTDAAVMQEDDKGQFSRYFMVALANLGMILSRRMSKTADYNNGVFILDMHDNHDDNILPILINNCYEYVVKKVLEQWYHADLGSELDKLEINHCLHYRKNPVHRRVMPLF
jgi:hypothetical protein